MYTVIGSVGSRTFRVLWTLEELELDYHHIPAKPRSDEVKQHYPAGKVPVLMVDGTAITDSIAIMTYLADNHGCLTYPAGSIERAVQDAHTNFLVDEFDAILWAAARHTFVLPEEHRVPDVKASLRWEYERSLKRLEQRLGEGPFLMGKVLTIADLLAAHCSRWAENAKFPAPSERLNAYFQDLRNRPAFHRASAKT